MLPSGNSSAAATPRRISVSSAMRLGSGSANFRLMSPLLLSRESLCSLLREILDIAVGHLIHDAIMHKQCGFRSHGGVEDHATESFFGNLHRSLRDALKHFFADKDHGRSFIASQRRIISSSFWLAPSLQLSRVRSPPENVLQARLGIPSVWKTS